MLSNKILFGTYHKTGTNLISQTLIDFAKLTNRKYVNILGLTEPIEADIIFSDNSNFNHYSYPAIHLVRDPRDMAISGERYHALGKEITKEEWLGNGYSDELNSIDIYKDRLIYEAENITKYTCSKIINNLNKDILTIKYECLYLDINNDYACIKQISDYFNLNDIDFELLRDCFTANHPDNIKKDFVHVFNGGIEQYKDLPADTLDALNACLHNEISILGY